METAWLVLLIAAVYIVALAAVSYFSGRSTRTSSSFASGGRPFPAILIGFLLASEFIGTTASVGTAQAAYESGISAAWNVASLGVGFVLFSFLLARRYRALGENTISGALASHYGERVRIATSVIMISALLIVAVSVYASGGAVLSRLLDIDQSLAIVLVGVLATAYVSVGGMRSVVYTNMLHAVVKIVGIIALMFVAIHRVGGMGKLSAALPDSAFSWDGVGVSQIFAWMIAGVGATFATQYVLQAITTVESDAKVRRTGFYAAVILIPYGILATVIGMCSAVLFPHIKSIQAMPALVTDLNPLLAGLVVSGLAGAMFGTIAALTIGASTLIFKDFYQPYFNPDADERRNFAVIRIAAGVTGLVPIALALFADDVLSVTFLAKALRAGLAVLVLLMFYAPGYGSGRGAFWSIVISLVATIGWYVAGKPFGLDEAYVAVAAPLMVMTVSHLLRRRGGDETPSASAETAPSHSSAHS
ncbi:sodium:solute symporter family protein [Streptomyces sp. SID8361]|uniref:sodium:solute symporter family protein n=1 Tax=Streptomyces sp. MnatMP-M27 TaxID=1839768 RepID=UPI00081DE347|nr:sodium:solute symporter family protein [Streptomyces sp. MnatMP-M27]MYU15852.1 sodium:solute symporter family protein [Streptomyces sp. SID8361]SCG10399.1 solute:Na+ symporter, SSS family [Streptomyces sp. MnatMP-M27]